MELLQLKTKSSTRSYPQGNLTMISEQQRWLQRVDQLLEKGRRAIGSIRNVQDYPGGFADGNAMTEFRAASRSFLLQTYGDKHPHFKLFESHPNTSGLPYCMGVMGAVRDEIAGGWLNSVRGLLAGELFSDFLEMADHLLEEGYKDAAAVIIGSTLEGHLRQLAVKHSIDPSIVKNGNSIPKKAEMLNAELTNVAYEKQDNKNVTAWLNLRNNAAHGAYVKYTIEEVRIMASGVRDFMTRVPA
jgi:hypothetical protein